MSRVRWGDQTFQLDEGESVLDALLRNGVKLSYACKSGSCGSCMLRAQEGVVPPRAQAGLKDSWKAQGYFLACVCVPEVDLTVSPVGADVRIPAAIVSIAGLSASVKQVRLHCYTSLDFRAGQYVTITRADGLSRSYSIASLPEQDVIELHVRLIPNGRMSGWLHHEAQPGDRLTILGPAGECFYVPGKEDQPLLLAGTGTGLAPLWGVLRDALRSGHRGPIHVYHGAVHQSGLYLCDELRGLADAHEQINYTAVLLNGDPAPGTAIGAMDKVILERFPKLAGWRAYMAGDPETVRSLKMQLFLAGMGSRDMFADPFLPSAA
jgi:CDP-4-dehydro-6-deoxyglucose reductase, E3